MYVCLCTTHRPGAHRSQKKALDSLKLKLWMIVSHHTGAGNQTWTRKTGTDTPLSPCHCQGPLWRWRMYFHIVGGRTELGVFRAFRLSVWALTSLFPLLPNKGWLSSHVSWPQSPSLSKPGLFVQPMHSERENRTLDELEGGGSRKLLGSLKVGTGDGICGLGLSAPHEITKMA